MLTESSSAVAGRFLIIYLFIKAYLFVCVWGGVGCVCGGGGCECVWRSTWKMGNMQCTDGSGGGVK